MVGHSGLTEKLIFVLSVNLKINETNKRSNEYFWWIIVMKRDVIKINEEKCTGCGECIPGCPEGALQVIDGKARLISDLFCDGLGACIGNCPQGAIEVEQREAEPYDEYKVMENVIKAGPKCN